MSDSTKRKRIEIEDDIDADFYEGPEIEREIPVVLRVYGIIYALLAGPVAVLGYRIKEDFTLGLGALVIICIFVGVQMFFGARWVIWAVSMAFVIGVVDLIWCLASGSTVRMLVEMGLVCLLYVPVMISGLRNLDELE